ncbi:MAG: methylated-DNA--[protein]-cysteine S-methyltransferase [Roseibium sp.]|nr:methylated-DNA--[protein]-cysteine S-methyltransferase [Roseibium sp.]
MTNSAQYDPVLSMTTPVGQITLAEKLGAISTLQWGERPGSTSTPLLVEARRQLNAYFEGRLSEFDLPLAPDGTDFHLAVYDAMLDIPYGQTRTYGQIAADLDTYGQPIGQACGANPIPIIIPCHRVLAADGLGGYSGRGGVDTKITLLKLEGGYPFLL